MPAPVPGLTAFLSGFVLQAASASAGRTNKRDDRIMKRPFLGLLCQCLPQRLGGQQGFSTNGQVGSMSAPRIETKIATDSEEFRARSDHNRALAAKLRADV